MCLQKEKSAEYMGICTECADKIWRLVKMKKCVRLVAILQVDRNAQIVGTCNLELSQWVL